MSSQRTQFGWGHININVHDLEQSIAFYEKLGFTIFLPGIPYLGLTAEGGPADLPDSCATALGVPSDIRGRACIMQLDDGFPKIDLTEFSGDDKATPLGNADLGLARICLVSENLQEDYERLSAQGVRFLSAPQTGKDGLADVAVCVDPDGTLIELLQVYLEKWQSLPGIGS